MRRPRFEVSVASSLRGVVPDVFPAVQAIPDEYRETPTRLNITSSAARSTVRECAPYFDAMTAGLVIPLPVDIRIIADGSNVKYFYRTNGMDSSGRTGQPASEWMSHHESAQAAPAILGKAILKVHSPYYVKTRRGWGALFLPLLNRQTPLRAVAGLVNTSKYRSGVNIPLTWEGEDGDFDFAQGTPIAQLIPVPLGEQSYSMTSIDRDEAEQRDKDGAACMLSRHVYKTRFREKVTWKKVER